VVRREMRGLIKAESLELSLDRDFSLMRIFGDKILLDL